jgi:4'-phosphopantetheinyl transferase
MMMNQKVSEINDMAGQRRMVGESKDSTSLNSHTSKTEMSWIPWTPTKNRISIPADLIHIWLIQLSHIDDPSTLDKDMLSDQEFESLRKFHFERDRRRYLVSHCALRIILARYLGIAPSQVQYQYSTKGKPSLIKPSGVYFNLAHSHEIALVAVAAHEEIGVDVEIIRPIEDIDQLARTCFSPREFQEFTQTSPSASQRAFFNGWTRKEAYIKAVGDGLSHPLDQFDVSLLPSDTPLLKSITGRPDVANQWTLQDIQLEAEYTAAFAVKANQVNVRYLSFFEQ